MFAALLLAGGRSVRMGQDKALLDWQGRALWRVQLDKLRELGPDRLWVACREEQGLHQQAEPGVEWLFDPPDLDCGPIGPITQALEQVQMPLLVLAVDMPQMTVRFLQDVIQDPSGISLFFRLAHGPEPLAGVYTPALLPGLQAAMQLGQYGLQRVLEQAEAQNLAVIPSVSEWDAQLFANANTPKEWQQVIK